MLDSSITSALRVHNTSNVTLWCARIIALKWETFTGWAPMAHWSITEKKKKYIQTCSTKSIMSSNIHCSSISCSSTLSYENLLWKWSTWTDNASSAYWIEWHELVDWCGSGLNFNMKWNTQTIYVMQCDFFEWNRIFNVLKNVVCDLVLFMKVKSPFPKSIPLVTFCRSINYLLLLASFQTLTDITALTIQ